MNKYSIYCTKGQTKKALELGAPIDNSSNSFDSDCTDNIERLSNGLYAIIPTAEQMISWLEEHIDNIDILKNKNGKWAYLFYPASNSCTYKCEKKFLSRKEATLAAIDAALEYLSKTKKLL